MSGGEPAARSTTTVASAVTHSPSTSSRRVACRPPPSALEQEFDVVAEEVLHFFGQLAVLGQAGVGVEDLLGHPAGLQHHRLVAGEPAELQVGEAGLAF